MTYNTIQYAQKKNEQLSTKLYINPPVFVKTSLYSAMWSYGVRLGTVCTVENISMQREIWLKETCFHTEITMDEPNTYNVKRFNEV